MRELLLVGAVLVGCGRVGYEPIDNQLYISPDGNDANLGTRSSPFRTWSHALSVLAPGDVLVALSGRYSLSTGTGYAEIDCSEDSTVCAGGPCPNGEPGNPITVRADVERRAFLDWESGGESAPIEITGCSHWTVEGLRGQNHDALDGSISNGAGTSVDLSNNIVLRRLLMTGANRYFNSHPIVVSYSSSVLVEECEVYDFHRIGIDGWKSDDIIVRRSYANPREYEDIPGGRVSSYPPGGDTAISLEHGSRGLVENNVVEGDLALGMNLQAADGPGTGDGYLFQGNVSIGGLVDVRSGCDGTDPCVEDQRVVSDNVFRDNVIVGRRLSVRGVTNTVFENTTQLGGAESAYSFDLSSGNAGLSSSVTVRNSLAAPDAGDGFSIVDQAEHTIEDCNAWVAAGFDPFSAGLTGPSLTQIDPNLHGCMVYIPDDSPMRKAGIGGKDIGARIVFRSEDGTVTSTPLWDPSTGAFPCGAVIDGVNDPASFPGATCADVHERLHVGSGGCPLPGP